MLNIKKILLPVDFPNTSLTEIRQAAMLAHHFGAEILMLHVVTMLSRTAGMPEAGREPPGWDLLATILQEAKKQQDPSLERELEGLNIRRMLGKAEPSGAIVQTAAEEKVDLIMMPSRGYTFDRFLLGSVTAKVLNRTDCPVWTGAHTEDSPAREFAIRNVLCAVDLGPRSSKALLWTAQFAAEFGARVTLAHVTAGFELWGPGGWYVNQAWKEELLSNASRSIEELKKDTGVKAEVFIGSGDVPKILNAAAKQTNADLLVMDCYPFGGNLRTHGYAIICAVPIPVLSI